MDKFSVKPSHDVAARAMYLTDYSYIDAVAVLFAAQYNLLLTLFNGDSEEVLTHMLNTIDLFAAGK